MLAGPATLAANPSMVLMDRAEVGFDNLSTTDGLSNNTVMALAQDETGFIWIGTLGGLNRFDGYSLRTFDHDPADPGTLPNGFVRALQPAPGGGMWLGTHTAGVAFYDPRTDRFTTLGAGPDGLGHVQVYGLASDGAGGVWVATIAGLDRVRADITVAERVRAGQDGFPPGYVFAVFRDRGGTLWAGTEKGMARRAAGSRHWQVLKGEDEPAAHALETGVWSFYQDTTGQVWIGTNGGGIVTVPAGGDAAQSHPRLTGPDTGLGRHTVRGIVEERPGVLWISLFGGGVAEYDTGLDRLSLIRADPNVPRALKGNFTRAIMKDRGDVVWVATNMGVARHNAVPSGIASIATGRSRGFSGRDVWSLWADARNGLWIGQDDGGLDRLDLSNGRITPFGRSESGGLPASTPIYGLVGNGSGDLWIGAAGLYRLAPADGADSITGMPLPGPVNRDVTTLASTGDDLWIGTYYGLARQPLAGGGGRLYTTDPADPQSLSNNEVWAILPERDGALWVGTANGLNLMTRDGKFRRIHRVPGRTDGLPHDFVSALVHDSRGRLWVGTVGGGVAVMLDGPTQTVQRFQTVSKAHGLPSNTIASLALGGDGRIWAGTDNGLAAIDTVDFSVTRVNPASIGNVFSYLPGSVTTISDGGLVFGGTNGLTLVQPSLIQPPRFLDALAVTAVTAGNRAVNASALNLPGRTRAIRVPADNRRLEVAFSLLDYANASQVHYAYRLEGFDMDWVQAGIGRRVASYTNLPPGSYRLYLRALDADTAIVSERVVTVIVPHVWHERSWIRFLSLIVLLSAGAGMVMLLERSRIAKLSEAKSMLEARVAERTQSLREANDRLAELATRDALTGIHNRRAFMERLDQEWSANLRHQQPFCVLMLDLDHFKEINDNFGHLVGDTVLREVAQRIAGALRETDLLARYGGEEFAVLMSHTDAAAARIAADRIHEAVGGAPFRLEGLSLSVTISIGVAQADPARETQTRMFNRADAALYEAKSAGRNQAAVAADP
ncbi:diguanylate cyclase [Niveispirillum fermenti]|uniref:ligand-binding sensor domain-containing diguanylate cyclase n=1 Tax=Niveispirillum fermenti TaxID=1233113 RepID=UPI003A87FA43